MSSTTEDAGDPRGATPSPTPPDPVRNAFDRGVAVCGRIAAWLVLVAMVISVYEVIMRYAFASPTSWVHETVVMLV
ncbi:TRAP transporter small permease subunit, partial [Halomonas elongata]|uniref:TRAP transporter small permease subunit n=1 Tax=Halomonas elongata TaxID=2746 RepID=UPI003D1878D7